MISCQRRDKFSKKIQARKTFQRQCRHERRTGCLAPPPLPNSEVFCQVERGEEVIGRYRCHPLRGGVKNEYFTVRLTVRVDPPLYGQLFVIYLGVRWG